MESVTLDLDWIKRTARELLLQLPLTATKYELDHAIHVRVALEKGLRNSERGRTISVDDIRKEFGLPE